MTLRVPTTEVGTLQALLGIKRQGPTSDSMMERDLIHLRHSHDRLKGLPKTWALMQSSYFILMLTMTQFFVLVLGDCAWPCLISGAMFDWLVFFSAYFVLAHELCS